MRILSDCHMHTDYSADCDTPVRNQLDRAVELGLKRVCITDHHDYDAVSDGGVTFLLDFEPYFVEMNKVKKEYEEKIEVLIGVELGLQLHIADYLKELEAKYNNKFDFIIGSSHFVDRIDVFSPSFYEGREERESYNRYFEATLRRIKELDCFDTFAHLDYVVRYGPNKNKYYSYEAYKEYIDPILEQLIKKDKALECNAGGYRRGLGQPNPSKEVFKRYYELGGRLVTIESDAHKPDAIAYPFDDIAELLSDCGFKEYAVYKKRKPEFYPILK